MELATGIHVCAKQAISLILSLNASKVMESSSVARSTVFINLQLETKKNSSQCLLSFIHGPF